MRYSRKKKRYTQQLLRTQYVSLRTFGMKVKRSFMG